MQVWEILWRTLCDCIRVNWAAELTTRTLTGDRFIGNGAARFEIDRPWNDLGNSTTTSRIPFLHLRTALVIRYLFLSLIEGCCEIFHSAGRPVFREISPRSLSPASGKDTCSASPSAVTNYIYVSRADFVRLCNMNYKTWVIFIFK